MPVNVSFGSRVSRFKLVGLYPGSQPEDNPNAPSKYDVKKNVCRKRKPRTSPWKRQADTEEYAKHLGYIESVNKLRAEKERVKSGRGPGCYHIRRHTQRLKHRKDAILDIPNVSEARKPSIQDLFLLGCYGDDIYKSSSILKKSYANKPTFEWDGFFDRFRLPAAKTDAIPPNTYYPKDLGSMEAVLARVVSRRGHYDLFTGPRDGSTIKNHFTPRQPEGTDQIYKFKSQLDVMLKDPRKRQFGDFSNTTGRTNPEKLLCGKDHQHKEECYNTAKLEPPGPTSYNVDWHTIKQVEKSKYAFGSHRTNKVRQVDTIILPGPGRYEVKYNMCLRHGPRKVTLKYQYESRRDRIARQLEEQRMLREQQKLIEMKSNIIETRSTATLYSQDVGNLNERDSIETKASPYSVSIESSTLVKTEKSAIGLVKGTKTKKKKSQIDFDTVSNDSYISRKSKIDRKVEQRLMNQLPFFEELRELYT